MRFTAWCLHGPFATRLSRAICRPLNYVRPCNASARNVIPRCSKRSLSVQWGGGALDIPCFSAHEYCSAVIYIIESSLPPQHREILILNTSAKSVRSATKTFGPSLATLSLSRDARGDAHPHHLFSLLFHSPPPFFGRSQLQMQEEIERTPAMHCLPLRWTSFAVALLIAACVLPAYTTTVTSRQHINGTLFPNRRIRHEEQTWQASETFAEETTNLLDVAINKDCTTIVSGECRQLHTFLFLLFVCA